LHNLPGLAVAALRDLLGDPSALQWVLALGIETFDRDDLLSSDLRYSDLAGSYCLAVEMDGASATQTCAASEFRRCSRITHNKGVSFATSTEWSRPLMFRVVMLSPMAVVFGHEVPPVASVTSPVFRPCRTLCTAMCGHVVGQSLLQCQI